MAEFLLEFCVVFKSEEVATTVYALKLSRTEASLFTKSCQFMIPLSNFLINNFLSICMQRLLVMVHNFYQVEKTKLSSTSPGTLLNFNA